MDPMDCYSEDYSTARQRFLESARAVKAEIMPLRLSSRGPNREDLTIDIAWCGATTARRVMLHSSGIHGVEGFAGSAIQIQLLRDMPAIPAGTAIVFVHALNPWGMAWLRRFNERNVDLNRNCLAPGEPYTGRPDGYDALSDFLNPSRIHFPDTYLVRAAWLIFRHGIRALKEAVIVGQYDYARGLFFGGHELQEGMALYRDFLHSRLAQVEDVLAIDVHTGLGPFGEDTLLVSKNEFPQLRDAFGSRVQSLSSGEDQVAYPIRGGLHEMVYRLLDRSHVNFVCQEFGTYRAVQVLGALRRENCAHQNGGGRFPSPEKTALKNVFCPPQVHWKNNVLRRGRALFEQALDFLWRKSAPQVATPLSPN